MLKKFLVAFDFDHTLIDGNSDTIVRQLLESKPPEYKSSDCWTLYMQDIFKQLHEQGVDEASYSKTISIIQPTPHMIELLHFLDSPDIEVIIISDSNSVFIDMWLSAFQVAHIIKHVHTNQASFDTSGLLHINMYQIQSCCELCPENLCKGSVLNQHLKSRLEEGTTFSSVVYIGDGKNDFCPSTKLSEMDLVFARKGYYLERMFEKSEEKKKVAANIIVWSSASDIQSKLSTQF